MKIQKKITLILFLALLIPFRVLAQDRIDKNQASTVSTNYLRSIGITAEQISFIEEDYLNDTLCLYCIHYHNGRWTIVSASKVAYPVLATGENNDMSLLYNDNPVFNALIYSFKRNILKAEKLDIRDSASRNIMIEQDIAKRWDMLLVENKGPNSIEIDYEPGVVLLDIPNRGEVKWGQDINNNGGCSPSYNMYCPSGILNSCDCDKDPAGCAPVAMGQVMWYWQWPPYSPEDEQPYKWEIMPPKLRNTTTSDSADNIARLLVDLGSNMNAIYSCVGTAVLPGNIEGGFADFGYMAVDRRKRSDWRYGYSWTELVRTEINNNRPVVIYGEENTIFSGHFFVADGYLGNDNNMFHINMGHRGNDNTCTYLYATGYDDDQSAYVGISPSYLSSEILQHYHDSVETSSYLFAIGDLDLPDNYVSTIGYGENVIINAGRSIDLLPGFEASLGSDVTIEIDEYIQSTFNIAILGFPDYDNILEEGAIMKVANANSFECTIYENGEGDPIYQHSGSVRNNTARIWDGTNYRDGVVYQFDVTFRNNFGEKYHIVFFNNREDTESDTDEMPEQRSKQSQSTTIDSYTYLKPNPASETVTVASSFRIAEVELFSLDGRSLLRSKVDAMSTALNLDGLAAGTYIVRIATNNGTAYKKLVVK